MTAATIEEEHLALGVEALCLSIGEESHIVLFSVIVWPVEQVTAREIAERLKHRRPGVILVPVFARRITVVD